MTKAYRIFQAFYILSFLIFGLFVGFQANAESCGWPTKYGTPYNICCDPPYQSTCFGLTEGTTYSNCGPSCWANPCSYPNVPTTCFNSVNLTLVCPDSSTKPVQAYSLRCKSSTNCSPTDSCFSFGYIGACTCYNFIDHVGTCGGAGYAVDDINIPNCPSCLPDGYSCTQNSNCCNGFCNTNGICGPNCQTSGSCMWNSDCCSGYYCSQEWCTPIPPPPSCAIQNLSCPATCTIGQNFNVSYDYRNTDYLLKPYISQRIVDWSYTNNLWCLADQAVYDNSWHNVTRSVSCPDTSMTIILGGHSDAGHWTDWCNVSWGSAGIASGIGCSASCQITVVPAIPAAIGYVKIKHPLGILSLRLISFSDALSFLKGIFKIARFGGDTNASADLVETTDPNASPVRVKTPYGIKAWRKAP